MLKFMPPPPLGKNASYATDNNINSRNFPGWLFNVYLASKRIPVISRKIRFVTQPNRP